MKKKHNGAKKWPIGFGLLYLMVHFPLILVWKIGITGVGIGKRAKGIDIEMPGFPIPILFVPLPFVYQIEQALHDLCDPIKCDFYKGSGHREWFWFPAIVPAVVVIVGAWFGYAWLIDWYFHSHLVEMLFGLIVWGIDYIAPKD